MSTITCQQTPTIPASIVALYKAACAAIPASGHTEDALDAAFRVAESDLIDATAEATGIDAASIASYGAFIQSGTELVLYGQSDIEVLRINSEGRVIWSGAAPEPCRGEAGRGAATAVIGKENASVTRLCNISRTDQALALATARLNDAVHDHVVALANRCGSLTPALTRFVHFNNSSARAVGLPKSDKSVIAAMPIDDRAILAILRAGISARIPQWAAESEAEGGVKPHNRILGKAKAWAELEVQALRACGIEEVIGQAEALLALEVDR
jgi:hypothetical protein